MKHKIALFFLLLIFVQTSDLPAQIYDDPKYPELLESDAELYMSGINYTVERVSQREFIFKSYWEDTAMIAFFTTCDYKDLKTRHGLYYERNRDGSILESGYYKLGNRNGPWQKNNVFGILVDNKKEGVWVTKDKDGKVIREDNYENDEMTGISIVYDGKGNVLNTLNAQEREEANSKQTDYFIRPSFPGCDASTLDSLSYYTCSHELAGNFVKENLKYPPAARAAGIHGTVWMRITVKKDGTMTNIMTLMPTHPILVKAAYDLIRKMPRWNPAHRNGEPVEVNAVYPIAFTLME